MEYFLSLNSEKRNNIAYINKFANENGITSDLSRAALLAVISKESSFIPKAEIGYGNTPNENIRKIFGVRVQHLNEPDLSKIKKNDTDFFNLIYGGRYGNAPNEGYKYRGRGFNQLTFKSNYKKIGELIGVDLVGAPDKINELETATRAVVFYFLNAFKQCPKEQLAAHNTTGVNDFKTLDGALLCFYNANAGWGKSIQQIKADPTGGLRKAKGRVEGFLEMAKELK